MKIVFEPAAHYEVVEAVAWYLEKAGPHYAEALNRELDAKLALLVQHPQIGTPDANSLRRLPLRVFPYTLHYKVEVDSIRIFAMAHQKRRPGYWRKR